MKRSPVSTLPALKRASKRASILIEALLREMQKGLNDPRQLQSEEWVRLFGDKQSMVANLQKLVQSLATLAEPRGRRTSAGSDYPEGGMMNPQDMQILSAWLSEERPV